MAREPCAPRSTGGEPRRADGVCSILDTQTGEVRDVLRSEDLSMTIGNQDFTTISRDGHNIYVDWYSTESSIWMLTLGEKK